MTSLKLKIFGKNLERSAVFLIENSVIPNLVYLKDCNLKYTQEIISNLENVALGEQVEYEWGQERIIIESYQNYSRMKDTIYNIDLGKIPTIFLIKFMKQWASFLKEWSNEDKFNTEVKLAFSRIKKSRKYNTPLVYIRLIL